MYRTTNKDIWRVFREHHYLSAEMNKASVCYTVYWDDTLVGFFAYLYYPSGTTKYAWRGSRIVILPDYQGLGIGTKVMEFLDDYYLSTGQKIFHRSSHLRFGRHWEHSSKWIPTASNRKISRTDNKSANYTHIHHDQDRICYAYEYMGDDYVNKPHLYIHVDDNEKIDYDILYNDLVKLKEKYWLCVITGEIKTPNKIEDICLELGIRTQLLYVTKKGVSTLNSKYKDKKIITKWDETFSNKIKRYYNLT